MPKNTRSVITSKPQVEINQSQKPPCNPLEEFLQKALEGDNTTDCRVDRYRNTDTSHLEEDLEQLELILKSDELSEETALGILAGHWQKLIKVAPPEIISLLCTHQKTSHILMHMSEDAKSNSSNSWYYKWQHTFILQELARRVCPIKNGEQWRTCTIPAERGMKALSEIAINPYFEISRGQDELRQVVSIIDRDIRDALPPYRMVLQSNELTPELVADSTVYLYAKGGNIHYQAKDYEGTQKTGVIKPVPGFPRIEIGRDDTHNYYTYNGYNASLEPRSSQLRDTTEKGVLYLHAFTEKFSDSSVGKKILVSWMDERGEVKDERDLCYHFEDKEQKRLFERISNFTTPLTDAEKLSFYRFGPIARMGLGPYGTTKLLEDLQSGQCDRELSFHEEQIIRKQLPRFRSPHDYESPVLGSNVYIKTADFHEHVVINPATYVRASAKAVAMDHQIDCIKALRERCDEIHKSDSDALQIVFELANEYLTAIQPAQNSAFKDSPKTAMEKIQSVELSDRRSDLKIRRLVQVLVDIRNEIKSTKHGRGFSLFGLAITNGSKTAIAIDDLINAIQQSLSDYENFKFKTSLDGQENMTVVWAEGLRKEDHDEITIELNAENVGSEKDLSTKPLLSAFFTHESSHSSATKLDRESGNLWKQS